MRASDICPGNPESRCSPDLVRLLGEPVTFVVKEDVFDNPAFFLTASTISSDSGLITRGSFAPCKTSSGLMICPAWKRARPRAACRGPSSDPRSRCKASASERLPIRRNRLHVRTQFESEKVEPAVNSSGFNGARPEPYSRHNAAYDADLVRPRNQHLPDIFRLHTIPERFAPVLAVVGLKKVFAITGTSPDADVEDT